MIDLTPSRLATLLIEAQRLRAEDRLMHLTIANLAYHGGNAAKKLAEELTQQAGLAPARKSPFARIAEAAARN